MTTRRSFVAAGSAALAGIALPHRARAAEIPGELTIAIQPGIGYGNLLVMKYQTALERRYPNTKFNWPVLTNGDAIRDGIISGQIAVGSGGTGPFLIGWDRGVGYKLIGALNQMDLWLMSRNSAIKSLKDFKPGMKIGMPSPDSIQAVALRMGCQQELGNAHALDTSIVTIQHPLGLVALQNGQLDAHLTSPPFQFQEAEAGAHVVFRSWQATGRSTFNSVYTTEAFVSKAPDFVHYFYSELSRATDFINKNPRGFAEILSKDSGGRVAPAQYEKWLKEPGVEYTIIPHGFVKQARFMKEIGMLTKAPASIRDLELPMLGGVGD
jgi:NitT/TauT family transport system substrate-binding protein